MVAFHNFKKVVFGQEKSQDKNDSISKAENAKESYRSNEQQPKPTYSEQKKENDAKENNINILNKKQNLKA